MIRPVPLPMSTATDSESTAGSVSAFWSTAAWWLRASPAVARSPTPSWAARSKSRASTVSVVSAFFSASNACPLGDHSLIPLSVGGVV